MYVALKIDKIEFYLCVEKQVSCTRMEGEKGLGTDISKTPIYYCMPHLILSKEYSLGYIMIALFRMIPVVED